MAQKVPPISRKELLLWKIPVGVGVFLVTALVTGIVSYLVQLGAEQLFGLAGAAGITLSRILGGIVVILSVATGWIVGGAAVVVPSGWMLITRTYGTPKVYSKGFTVLKPVIETVVEWDEDRIFREIVMDIKGTTKEKWSVTFNVQITFRRKPGEQTRTVYEVKKWYQTMLDMAEGVAQSMIGTLTADQLNELSSAALFLLEAQQQAAKIYGEVLDYQIVDKTYDSEIQQQLAQAAAAQESAKALSNVVAAQLTNLQLIDEKLREMYPRMPAAERSKMAQDMIGTGANITTLPRLHGVVTSLPANVVAGQNQKS